MITLQQELRKIVQMSKGKRIDKSSDRNQSKRSLLNEFENNCSIIQGQIRSRRSNLSKHQKSGMKLNTTNNENSINPTLNTLNSTKSYNSSNMVFSSSNRTSSKSVHKSREPLKVAHKDFNESKQKIESKPLTTTNKKLKDFFNELSPQKDEKVYFNNLLQNQKKNDEKTFKKSENIETFSFNNFPREYFSENVSINAVKNKYEEQDRLKILENDAFSKRKLDFSAESKKSSHIFMNSDLEYEQLINEKEDKFENMIASPKYNLFIDEPIMEMPDESTKNTKPFSYQDEKEEKTLSHACANEPEFTQNYAAIKFDNYDEEEKTQFRSELNFINEKCDSNNNYESINDRNYDSTQPLPVFSVEINDENDKVDNGSPTKIENQCIKEQDSVGSINMIIDPTSQYLDYPEGNTIAMLNVNNSIQFSKPYILNGNLCEHRVVPEAKQILNFKKKIEEPLETQTETFFNSRATENSNSFAFNSFHDALKSYKSSGNFCENNENNKEKQDNPPKLITSEIIYIPVNNENYYQPSSFLKKLEDSNFKNQHYSNDARLVQSDVNEYHEFNDEFKYESSQTYNEYHDNLENEEKEVFYNTRTNEYEYGFSNKKDQNNELQRSDMFYHDTVKFDVTKNDSLKNQIASNSIHANEMQNNMFKTDNYNIEAENNEQTPLFSPEKFEIPKNDFNQESFIPTSFLSQQNKYDTLKLSSTQKNEDQITQKREKELNSLVNRKEDNLDFVNQKKEDHIPKLDISKTSKLSILKSQDNFAPPSFGNSYNFEIEANFLIPLTSDRSLFTTENNENNEEDKIPFVARTFPLAEYNDVSGKTRNLNMKNMNSNENEEHIENIKNYNFYSNQAEGRVREEAEILSEIKKMVEFGRNSAEQIVGEIFSEATLIKISKTYFRMKMEVIFIFLMLHIYFYLFGFKASLMINF